MPILTFLFYGFHPKSHISENLYSLSSLISDVSASTFAYLILGPLLSPFKGNLEFLLPHSHVGIWSKV